MTLELVAEGHFIRYGDISSGLIWGFWIIYNIHLRFFFVHQQSLKFKKLSEVESFTKPSIKWVFYFDVWAAEDENRKLQPTLDRLLLSDYYTFYHRLCTNQGSKSSVTSKYFLSNKMKNNDTVGNGFYLKSCNVCSGFVWVTLHINSLEKEKDNVIY